MFVVRHIGGRKGRGAQHVATRAVHQGKETSSCARHSTGLVTCTRRQRSHQASRLQAIEAHQERYQSYSLKRAGGDTAGPGDGLYEIVVLPSVSCGALNNSHPQHVELFGGILELGKQVVVGRFN